jgi:hypothetical protein
MDPSYSPSPEGLGEVSKRQFSNLASPKQNREDLFPIILG